MKILTTIMIIITLMIVSAFFLYLAFYNYHEILIRHQGAWWYDPTMIINSVMGFVGIIGIGLSFLTITFRHE